MIRAIGFDYLGVVARLSGESIYERIGTLAGTPADDVKAAYQQHNGRFQTGEIDRAELWRLVSADIGRTGMTEEIVAATEANLPVIDPEVLAYADDLRGRGYKTGLLTNLASGTAWDRDLYERGVDRHFDAVLLSGETGLAKPDPRAFKLLAERLGVQPSELVFIDDRASSMEGVEALGITPILFTNLPDLRGRLAEIMA